jgi:pyruvate formate lyase activating enzyme
VRDPDFSGAAAEAHQRGINTAIETAGNVPWALQLLPHVDVMLHDHKSPIPSATRNGPEQCAHLKTSSGPTDAPNVKFVARTPLFPE